MSPENQGICGIWVSPESEAHLSLAGRGNTRREIRKPFHPFLWVDALPPGEFFKEEKLSGEEPYNRVVFFKTVEDLRAVTRENGGFVRFENIRPFENQYLLGEGLRLFGEMNFRDLRRCQCDIETASSIPGGFSNSKRREDRILAVGLRFNNEEKPVFLTLEDRTDESERRLLRQFIKVLRERDPDVIEGHNFFNFDLNYLRNRSRMLKVPCAWGRFGENAVFRQSRLKVAERWIDFLRCDIPGRAVIDTYFLIQLFDITKRDLPSYSLKEVARYLGITALDSGERTYLPGNEIERTFYHDREKFIAYLGDDLRETEGVARFLLPTYFAQTGNFPMTLQEIVLRGTAQKVDCLLLEKYFQERRSLPEYPEVSRFEGGYARSFATGVFRHVLHFDVASLYPSLLLMMGRNPANDSLEIFIPLLRKLRNYRLKYKEMARVAEDDELRMEYNARQNSFKILINSFYGYLGFQGARFSDSELAAEVTRRGRELLQSLIEGFKRLGSKPLEADTDGIYISDHQYFDNPERLLRKVHSLLPEGIELEYDGRYLSMFCYKAKNYALYDGEKVTVRGSALRSRGMEPYLKSLTGHLIRFLLGLDKESPLDRALRVRRRIERREMDISKLAKSEYLSRNPEVYRKNMEAGGKPRRASLEVALKMKPAPKMGEKVSYYILPKEKGMTADWRRARALGDYEPAAFPYDPVYYTKKIDAWLKRYGEFIGMDRAPTQEELFP